MPDEPGDGTTFELIPNPVILKLKELSKQPVPAGPRAKALALSGFLGDPDVLDDYIDLYLQLDLTAFYRIAKTDLLWVVPFDTDPTKPVTILVESTANIELVFTGEASFITGSIVATSPFIPDDSMRDTGPKRFPTVTSRGCTVTVNPTGT